MLYAGTLGLGRPHLGPQLPPARLRGRLPRRDDDPAGPLQPVGSIAAVYFLVTGITGLQLLGVQTFVQQLFYGGALVLAVALSQLARRRDAVAS